MHWPEGRQSDARAKETGVRFVKRRRRSWEPPGGGGGDRAQGPVRATAGQARRERFATGCSQQAASGNAATPLPSKDSGRGRGQKQRRHPVFDRHTTANAHVIGFVLVRVRPCATAIASKGSPGGQRMCETLLLMYPL